MRSHVIMEVLVFRQGDAGLGDGELAVVEVPEFDPRGVVGSMRIRIVVY